MHISDGILSGTVLAAGFAGTAVVAALLGCGVLLLLAVVGRWRARCLRRVATAALPSFSAQGSDLRQLGGWHWPVGVRDHTGPGAVHDRLAIPCYGRCGAGGARAGHHCRGDSQRRSRGVFGQGAPASVGRLWVQTLRQPPFGLTTGIWALISYADRHRSIRPRLLVSAAMGCPGQNRHSRPDGD